jgi:phosphoserine phosphatase RsbU/P
LDSNGVAASLLMTHLSAIFRSLVPLGLPLAELVGRANRLFSESTPSAQYATVACGRLTSEGVELCNAGHCPPLLLGEEVTESFEATGMPLGLFGGAVYDVKKVSAGREDSFVLDSDGITETRDAEGNEGVLRDVAGFRGGRAPHDDMSLMIMRRRQSGK